MNLWNRTVEYGKRPSFTVTRTFTWIFNSIADKNSNLSSIRTLLLLLLLTLKWQRYFYSHWCPRGGSMEPPRENHFPTGILQWNLHHICTGHKKSQFCKKKKIKCCTVSKWRPNNRFLFRVISILAKFWKNTFPKEFFNEIWLKEGEYE